MDFPKSRMRVVRTHQGNSSTTGWLELNFRGVELEGVNTLMIDLAEVDRLRAAGNEQEDALAQARSLLGG
jgi:hypothetical protein